MNSSLKLPEKKFTSYNEGSSAYERIFLGYNQSLFRDSEIYSRIKKIEEDIKAGSKIHSFYVFQYELTRGTNEVLPVREKENFVSMVFFTIQLF